MAGFDKVKIMEELEALGWTEDGDESKPNHMVPPQSLFENAPKSFHVYDANELQLLLEPHLEGKEGQPHLGIDLAGGPDSTVVETMVPQFNDLFTTVIGPNGERLPKYIGPPIDWEERMKHCVCGKGETCSICTPPTTAEDGLYHPENRP